MEARHNWDKKIGLGQEEILRAMITHNDLTFIYHYLTPEFCAENKLHTYEHDNEGDAYVSSEEFDDVRSMLARSLMNLGEPKLAVVDANHANRGELVILHSFDGQELNRGLAEPTCKNLQRIWTRPVHVLTQDKDGTRRRISYDGKTLSSQKASDDYQGYFERIG